MSILDSEYCHKCRRLMPDIAISQSKKEQKNLIYGSIGMMKFISRASPPICECNNIIIKRDSKSIKGHRVKPTKLMGLK